METSDSFVGRRDIDDRLLQKVSNKLGPEWERLATILGFTTAEISNFKVNHPNNVERQSFNMLTTWKQKQSLSVDQTTELHTALNEVGRMDLANEYMGVRSTLRTVRERVVNEQREAGCRGQDGPQEGGSSGVGGRQSGDAEPGDRDNKPRYEDGKGYVLFINNFVTASAKTGPREGCKYDTQNITTLFNEKLPNYKCVSEEDLPKSKLPKVLENTKKELVDGSFTRFILIIGSHGSQLVYTKNDTKGNLTTLTAEQILMQDEECITEEDLTAPFMGDQFKDFEGKPKVFIVQACRTSEPLNQPDDEDQRKQMSGSVKHAYGAPKVSLPVNADVLISYATSKGTPAWRNTENGSWYIYHLCEIIRNHYEKENMMDLLIRVNDEVARMEINEERAKQMPCQVSTLTKHIWL